MHTTINDLCKNLKVSLEIEFDFFSTLHVFSMHHSISVQMKIYPCKNWEWGFQCDIPLKYVDRSMRYEKNFELNLRNSSMAPYNIPCVQSWINFPDDRFPSSCWFKFYKKRKTKWLILKKVPDISSVVRDTSEFFHYFIPIKIMKETNTFLRNWNI